MRDNITLPIEIGQDGIMALVEKEERIAGVLSHRAVDEHGCVVAASTSAVLRRIREIDIALAIWERTLEQDLLDDVERLLQDHLADVLLITPARQLDFALAEAMIAAGYRDVPQLRSDVIRLARQHCSIGGTHTVRIRLEIVRDDACRKFHADSVTVRTISTYRGQGTQWREVQLFDDDDGSPAEQLEAGWVGMFKGRTWQPRPTILHRSPPLRSSDEQRLVLVID